MSWLLKRGPHTKFLPLLVVVPYVGYVTMDRFAYHDVVREELLEKRREDEDAARAKATIAARAAGYSE
eukprot:CAMPEP_0182545410 /NCGR_PEP_ID=MMETSP1323-20130603/34530_1 /TAXON_ID=236787 /ORGANISM="Florenciella parvula, Strain RCC1693" /LENGTH=67 /DNA_ID=CAMNT_0024756561 /DNA_START=56 /DNA_END=256 /DNA_ORIENTATION=+